VLKLAGEEHFPAPYLQTIRSLTPSMTAFQAKIGVRKKLIRAGSLVGLYPPRHDGKGSEALMRRLYQEALQGKAGDYIPVYMPVPSNFDPELAPEGCQLITAVAAAPHLGIPLKDPPSVWMDKMMTALCRLVPGLEENMIFCDRWSVRALATWIGKSSGAAISTAQSVTQTGGNRLPHETPVPGLYLAGDCAGPARGVGTELACQSGMDCADRVTGDLAGAMSGSART
jgi:prolycopene isomerase